MSEIHGKVEQKKIIAREKVVKMVKQKQLIDSK